MRRARIAHIGTGKRTCEAYLPVIAALSDRFELVAVCGRSAEKAGPLARERGVPAYTDPDEMLDRHEVDMVTAIVSCFANLEVASRVAARGLSCVIETPIELSLKNARALLDLEARHGVRIEVAENWFRSPEERLVRKLLDEGVFGKVLVAYNHFRAHGYHGVSMLRNYVGFDVEPVSVTAHHQDVPRQGGESVHSRFGVIEFEGGAVGVHAMAYGLAVEPRGARLRFVAERGWLGDASGVVTGPGGERPVEIRRFGRDVGGVDACERVVAYTPGEIAWENPFAGRPLTDEQVSVASVLASMARASTEGAAPEYRLRDALVDYEVDTAMCSSHANGRRVELPFDDAALERIEDERRRELY